MPARQAPAPRERATGSRKLRSADEAVLSERPGRLARASCVSALPFGVQRAARHPSEGPRHRGNFALAATVVWKVHPSLSAIATDRPAPEHEAPRGASSQGGCEPYRQAAVSHGALLRKSLHGAAFAVVAGRGPHRHPQGCRQPGHRRHQNAVAPVGLVSTVTWCTRPPALWGKEGRRGRCVGVNAACDRGVWARDPDVRCAGAPLLRKGAEISCASTR